MLRDLIRKLVVTSRLVEGLGIYVIYYGGVLVLLSLLLRTLGMTSTAELK